MLLAKAETRMKILASVKNLIFYTHSLSEFQEGIAHAD
jgi:hypothetical protein